MQRCSQTKDKGVNDITKFNLVTLLQRFSQTAIIMINTVINAEMLINDVIVMLQTEIISY